MPILDIPAGSAFGLSNLPYGVFSKAHDSRRRIGVALGSHVLDLGPVAVEAGLGAAELLSEPVLNGFMAAGRPAWQATRRQLQALLRDESFADTVARHLVPLEAVTLHLPFVPGDYVDFYSSEHHATNVGRLFRPDSDPLTPNWKHLPIGYHGRAGTVVVSGTGIHRPRGLRKGPDDAAPVFAPSGRLDVEVEVGFVVGLGSGLGVPIPVEDFAEHVFGVCLVNDWSARDIQSFEYVPLGPFLGKSFATSVSPWIVPLEALGSARVQPPARHPQPAAYLADVPTEPWGLDIALELELNGQVLSRPPFATMYWTPAQQLAHMTVNGASTRTGDLYASGTVSGAAAGQRGSLLELCWGGSQPIELADGTKRTFLEDGDVVRIRATAPGPAGDLIGFGEVAGTILPATAM
ncbi:MAG TPA: fumarylacetoacetase [Acidimicrobiales bacterium]|nr:fumarylacetoacetase [Acidimicrobiales bacterium]